MTPAAPVTVFDFMRWCDNHGVTIGPLALKHLPRAIAKGNKADELDWSKRRDASKPIHAPAAAKPIK